MTSPSWKPCLPDALPESPLSLVEGWIAEALESIPNATAMTLATVEPDGRPSARMVICRGVDVESGWFGFYTDRDSPKGWALAKRPEAALVFHWQAFERQIRIEGPVTRAPDDDSDAYWNTRPRDARVAGSTSFQSQPIHSRRELVERFEANATSLGEEIPRPARWGGYRVWARRIELWVGQPGRLHDRALWERDVAPEGEGFAAGSWSATRLQP